MPQPEGLEVPPEPLEIKEEILRRARMEGGLEKAHVWMGNKLQSYLWSHWRDRLRREDYTWQRFLSVMRLASTGALWWAEGRISWEEFVRGVSLLIAAGVRPGRLTRLSH